MSKKLKSADIQLIQRIIPHRYPFLLVDKVTKIDSLKSAIGIKNVTFLWLTSTDQSRLNLYCYLFIITISALAMLFVLNFRQQMFTIAPF